MIDTGQKFLSAPLALVTVSLESRSHTWNFKNDKVFVYVFKTSLFPNLITKLIHLWFDEYFAHCNRPIPPPPTLGHVKIKVTDLEFSRKKNCNIRRLSCLATGLVSLPEHKVFKVSYCDHPLSVVRASSVVNIYVVHMLEGTV